MIFSAKSFAVQTSFVYFQTFSNSFKHYYFMVSSDFIMKMRQFPIFFPSKHKKAEAFVVPKTSAACSRRLKGEDKYFAFLLYLSIVSTKF